MVPATFSNAHHPFFTDVISLPTLIPLLLLFMHVSVEVRGQEITGLEVARTLEHQNYGVSAIDCYFENGHQLIAYSNASGDSDGDTLVLYDYAQDQVLSEVPGVNWSYDIRFIDDNQLLFRNSNLLYRLVNLTAPMTTQLQSNVFTFSLSPDKASVAILRFTGSDYFVEVSSYHSATGEIGMPEIYNIPEVPNSQSPKLSYSPDGSYIALSGGYENNYVYIINTTTKSSTKVNTSDNAGTYSPVFYEQTGDLRLAVGGGYGHGVIEIINVDALMAEAVVPAFQNYNYALAIDQSQEYLVCGGYDGILKLFHVDGTDFTEIEMYNTGSMTRLLFSQDNDYVFSANGGSGMAWVSIYHVLRGPSGTFFTEKKPLLLYPNPANGILHISGVQDVVVSVYDMHGRKVIEQETERTVLDIRCLSAGIYMLKTEDGKAVRTGVFVKDW